ncbi:MAG: hypothetical protein Q9178_007259 [Gyalolechia marmorata]
MPATPALADLALHIRDHIVAGTFDRELFNRYLQPHAVIVYSQQLGASTQNFGRSERLANVGGFSNSHHPARSFGAPNQFSDIISPIFQDGLPLPWNSARDRARGLNVAEPAHRFVERVAPVQKRRRTSPSNISDPVLVDDNETDFRSPCSSIRPAAKQQRRSNTTPETSQVVKQLAKEKFLVKWKEAIDKRPNAQIALERLCRFDILTTGDGHPSRQSNTPYFELNRLMDYVYAFGSPSVRQDLVSNLRMLMESNASTAPAFTVPPPIDGLSPGVQAAFRRLWRASQITDFWARTKEANKPLWRISITKEVGLFYEIIEQVGKERGSSEYKSIVTGNIKAKMYRMYEIMCYDPSQASRLKQRFIKSLLHSKPYLALEHHYQSDGIIAMVPLDVPVYTFESKMRIEAMLETLDLVKPDFDSTAPLRLYSECLNCIYEGGRLSDAQLNALDECCQKKDQAAGDAALASDDGRQGALRSVYGFNETNNFPVDPSLRAPYGSVGRQDARHGGHTGEQETSASSAGVERGPSNGSWGRRLQSLFSGEL